ncbi:nucleoside diphosphate kinase homolog 5-like [Eucyclogobius newberryi]|uniref:nucleoside diphosphate kinase homolog 5-like n=1 Tax=Eucyclogobius newberryi TaxID=166745 RepID=UPI003B58EDAA
MGTSTLDRLYVERTLALIKPDALHTAKEIEDVILHSGFTIVQRRMVHLSEEQCTDFYAHQRGKRTFSSLITFMMSGPILAYTLARENAISHWKLIMGPTSISKARETQPESLRAIYGTSDIKNAVHGSESFVDAEREIKFIFPNTLIEPFPPKEKTEEYLSKHMNPTLLMGLTELCKQKPSNPCIWLADWLLANNPNQPQISVEVE